VLQRGVVSQQVWKARCIAHSSPHTHTNTHTHTSTHTHTLLHTYAHLPAPTHLDLIRQDGGPLLDDEVDVAQRHVLHLWASTQEEEPRRTQRGRTVGRGEWGMWESAAAEATLQRLSGLLLVYKWGARQGARGKGEMERAARLRTGGGQQGEHKEWLGPAAPLAQSPEGSPEEGPSSCTTA